MDMESTSIIILLSFITWRLDNGHLRLMGSLESCWAKVETTRETLTSVGWLLMSTATNLSRRSGTEADKTMFVCSLSRIGNTSSHLHCMMFQTIQTIYFLWGYDPGNISVSFIAELSPVYCFHIIFILFRVFLQVIFKLCLQIDLIKIRWQIPPVCAPHSLRLLPFPSSPTWPPTFINFHHSSDQNWEREKEIY